MIKKLMPAFLIHIFLISCSNNMHNALEQLSDPILNQPIVRTKAIVSITAVSALSGGDIPDIGAAAVKTKGVCWSLTPKPLITDSCTVDGSGTGSFESTLSGLKPNTTYYVRAYAAYKGGASYGEEQYFKTDDSINDITDFKFLQSNNLQLKNDKIGIINGTQITVFVEGGTDISSLRATFTYIGATVKVGGITQITNITSNNFNADVIYHVVAVNGLIKDFTVSVYPAYQVFFDKNGADSGSVPVDLNYYINGNNITIPYNSGLLVKNNYTFAGWNTKHDGSGSNYNGGDTFKMASSNITLYANWTQKPTYRMNYISDGSDSGVAPNDLTNYCQNSQVKILDNTGMMVKAGYYFSGWKDSSGKVYTPGQIISMGNADITLTAVWAMIPLSYTITYNGNGANDGSLPAGGTYLKGGSVLIHDNEGNLKRIRDGQVSYSFYGWNTKADGSGIYLQNKTIEVTSNITLYAIWRNIVNGEVGTGPAGGNIVVDWGIQWSGYPYPYDSWGWRYMEMTKEDYQNNSSTEFSQADAINACVSLTVIYRGAAITGWSLPSTADLNYTQAYLQTSSSLLFSGNIINLDQKYWLSDTNKVFSIGGAGGGALGSVSTQTNYNGTAHVRCIRKI